MADKKPKYIEGIGWRYDTEHSMHRRMTEHDYRTRSIYMITMNVEGRHPLLGELKWEAADGCDAHVETTLLGAEVERCWMSINDYYPEAEPLRVQVRCHNNNTAANLRLIERQKAYFLDRGREGGVVVSPCISAGEKEIARAALDANQPLIVILENGFPPMYKPPGKYFEACTKGLLLMLAPWPYHMEKRTITRHQCLELNDMARGISTEPWTPEFEQESMS